MQHSNSLQSLNANQSVSRIFNIDGDFVGLIGWVVVVSVDFRYKCENSGGSFKVLWVSLMWTSVKNQIFHPGSLWQKPGDICYWDPSISKGLPCRTEPESASLKGPRGTAQTLSLQKHCASPLLHSVCTP